MTLTSQEVTASGVTAKADSLARYSTILRVSAAFMFAVALALAPAPAFAQHGGGGGGGGHAGGGFGGGHASGGSGGGGSHAGARSAPSGGGGSHAGGATASGSNDSSGGGHWWNPFHSSSNAAAAGSGKAGSGSSPTSDHYAAGNNTWQDPPAPAARAAGHANFYGPGNGARVATPTRRSTNGAVVTTRGASAVAAPPHVFPPRRRGYPNYYPYYPYYPYYGFGWGGGLWLGGFYPCDPFWGCYGYGYGYYGGSFSGDYSADLSYNSADDATGSQEANPTLYAAPAADRGQGGASEQDLQQPYVILYLKDGSSYAVSDYWLSGGKLHYVTSYGGENVIDESQLDLQRTVDENAARGVDFSLRPEPTRNEEAAPPAPVPDTQAAPPQR
jgi:hypothetical protein